MRGHGSGVEFNQPLGWVIEIREGKLRGLRFFLDPAEALQAAGLSE
jgi:ketosteroid isomerase-like protein